jgi:MYXO-CTERM domain-containing protein
LQPLSIQVVDGADSGCGCTSTRERAGSSLILLIGLVILAGASRLRRL